MIKNPSHSLLKCRMKFLSQSHGVIFIILQIFAHILLLYCFNSNNIKMISLSRDFYAYDLCFCFFLLQCIPYINIIFLLFHRILTFVCIELFIYLANKRICWAKRILLTQNSCVPFSNIKIKRIKINIFFKFQKMTPIE